MSNIISTYSRCISGCPWPCLASSKGIKGIDRGAYIIATDIGSTYARDACIGGACASDTSVRGIEPRVLERLRVTLPGLWVNNCYLQSLMG